MPIRPAPYSLKCPNCGWSKLFAPASDVLCHPSECPSCGNKKFIFSKLNPLLGRVVREIIRIGQAFRSRN